MSTTIDQRVVEMRFDNKQFESGVATSMSTIDKLKQKLNLSGASKGLEGVSRAAKNVSFSGMTSGIETVSARFSAMQVVGMTALANITNSAINTGKRMISALTIDPVKTGFQEYETQINAIQTILSNTRQEGTNVEIVNKALDELNKYADKTIYNFTEMTRNIGTFTAAGVKLDTSVNAIKGIANLAAVSGSTSQQASTAMYQLSQALAAGKVQLMDWNSVVNAGMGGKVFQDALVRTSELLGTGAKQAIETAGSFRESLTKSGWLTTEVLTETLNQLAGAYDKADLMAQGFTESQANEIMALAKNAEDAATKVKTFTQLWDVLKEAAQSGWAQTWRLIVGDFEEAKNLLTPLADFFTDDNGLITKMSNARNELLKSALGKGFTSLGEKVNKFIEPAKKAVNTVKEVKSTISDLGGTVDDVILGKLGNSQERFDKLTQSGKNWMEVQNKVNEKLGNNFRYTKEQISAQDKLLGSQEKTAKATSEIQKETQDLTDAQKKQIKELVKLSDEQLRSKGYTDEQIAAFRELKDTADKLRIPLDTFIDKLDEINGRWLLINSFKNIGKALGEVFGSIGNAWREIFDPIQPEQIFNVIAAFHKFTSSLIMNKESAENLKRTFKGLFAILDIVTTIAGGDIKFAFKTLTKILSSFHINILEITGNVGDAIVKFRDWIFEQNALAKVINGFVNKLPSVIANFKKWFDTFKDTPAVTKIITAIESIQSAFDKLTSGKIDVSSFAKKLGTGLAMALRSIPGIAIQIGKDFIVGFQNGIDFSVSGVINKMVSFCLNFVSAFAEALGVQSPSWKAFDIVVDFFQGAINGAKSMIGSVLDVFKIIGEQIVKIFKSFWDFITDESGNVEWDKIFAGGIVISMAWFLKQIATAFSGIANALGGFDDLLANAGKVMKSFSKVLNGIAWDYKAKAIQKMAISIAILVGAIYILTRIDDPAKLWNAVLVLGVLSGILVGLAVAMDKMTQASVRVDKSGASIEGLKTGLLQIGIALLLLASTVKLIGGMDIEQAKQGFAGLAGLAVGMLAFLAAMGGISRYSKDVSKIGGMMIKLSIAMMLMIGVIKLVDGLSVEEMLKGVAFAAAFAIFVRSITVVAKDSGENVSKVGGMILKLSIAMLLMVGVIKLIGMLSVEEMLKGVAFAAAFVIFVKFLVKAATMDDGTELAKVGGLTLAVSTSLLLMVGVCKLVSKLSFGEMIKGAAFVGGFIVMLKILVSILTISNEHQMMKIAGTILAMSTAIAILAGVAVVLSLVDLGGLAKGIIAVGLLSAMMNAMIKSLKGAQNVKGAIMMMAISIGIMAASVVALSFIEPDKLAGATAALAIIMGMFALIEKSSKNVTKSILPLATMVVAVGLLSVILYSLSSNISDVNTAIGSAAALSMLMLAISATMRIVSGMNTNIGKALLGILALTAMAIPLLTFVRILKLMSGVENATKNVMTLITLAGALILMLIPLTIVGTFVASAALGILALTAMAIPLLTFVGILKLMSGVENATTNIMLLTSFMGVMSNLLVKLALVGPLAIVGVAALTGLTILMGAISVLATGIGMLMEKFPSIQKFLDTGLPVLEQLAGSIGTMVGKFIGGIGEGIGDSLVKIGNDIAAFMLALSVASVNASGIKGESFDGVKKLIDVMGDIALSTVGTSLSDVFTLGGTSMEKFRTDAVAFFNAMKEISNASTGVTVNEESMNAVINIAKKLSGLQSSLEPIGGVMSWFSGRDDLATFGTNIGQFIGSMRTALSNLDGITLNEEALGSIITAASKLSELQSKLEPIGGVISWFSGRDDLATFGANIGQFIGSMRTALSNLDGVTLNEEALTSVISAASKLSELQSKLEPMGGVISWFTGRSDLGTFGTNVGLFADAMGKLKTGMGEDGITEAAVSSITNAGNAIIALQKALPEEGWFDGKMNLTEFSNYVSDFSTAMSDFGKKASEIDPSGIATVISSAYMIKSLIQSLVGLDTSGLVSFTGIGSGGIGADGAVSDIAKAIADFSKKTSDINISTVSTSVSAALKLKTLIASLAGLDPSGVENFKVGSIGSTMKSYSDKVKDIDAGVVSKSITAANRLKSFIAGLSGLDTSGISKFKVGSIGTTLKFYASSVSGFDAGAVSNSISVANKLKSFIASLSGLNTSGVGSFVNAIQKLGTVSIDGIVKSFSGASTKMLNAGSNLIESVARGMKSKQSALTGTVTNIIGTSHKVVVSKASIFMVSGIELMSRFATGIMSQRAAVSSAMLSAVSSAASSVRGYYSSFYSAGLYLGSGLVMGINAKQSSVYAAGYALGQKAVQGEKDGQKSKSPSKLTIQAGKWLGEGLVIGINKMGSKVYNAGYDLGDNAAKSMSNSISKIANIIESGVDMSPTIRPVLDLSNIKSGAGAINGMFDKSLSIGTFGNINAIGSMMSQKNQNGTTDDIVSAINKLNKKLDNAGTTVNNINGVTYDDGSNVSNAVSELIRAIKIEGRA